MFKCKQGLKTEQNIEKAVINMSIVRNKDLAKSGHEKIDWVKSYMPVLSAIEQDFKKNQV